MKCGIRWSIFVFSLVACSNQKSATITTDGRVSPTYQGPAEAAYCSTVSTFSDPVAVTGLAKYTRREPYIDVAHGTQGLGGALTTSGHPASVHPIRRAEVRVTDPAGNVVQCGTTDDSGNISITLPRGNVAYKLSVNSRAYHSLLKASVLNAPEQNLFYSLSTTVTPTTTVNFGTLMADADSNGTLLGAPFNILDQLYQANVFLRAQVSNCSAQFSGCQNVNTTTTLQKVSAYWTKGFNPNAYFGSSSGLSFYLPGYSRLFILGGNDGAVDTVDTDHFDNSVIVHEYGHFMEDTVGHSDSPGGSHDGNHVIDPRLAWSEGWGNFFQSAVIDSDTAAAAIYDGRYIDTLGNDDGSTDLAFFSNLETASVGNDYPTVQGEGNFREFSVTRLLWDAIDTHVDTQFGSTDNISGKFNEIWAAFSSTTKGFRNSGYSFRNIGLLHLIQEYFQVNGTPPASDWSSIRLMERQDGNEGHYGQYVTTSGCTAGGGANVPTSSGNHYYFQTVPNSIGFTSDGGSLSGSDQFRNNIFLRFRAPASGSHTITLRYQDADGVVQEADLDLYVYKEDYHFGLSSDMLGYSRNDPTGVVNAPEADEVAHVSLTSGNNYLININAYTGGASVGTQAYFNIYYDGNLVCPANIVQ